MVSAKELVQKLDFRVVARKNAVMIVVIFAIKEITDETRRRKATVICRTIVAVKNEVQYMNRKVRWEK